VCDAFENTNAKIINIVCDGNAITDDMIREIVCDGQPMPYSYFYDNVRDAFENAYARIINIVCDGNAITDDVIWEIVCDVHTNGNVYLGFAVWDAENIPNDPCRILGCDGSPDRTRAPFAMRVRPEVLSQTVSGSCGMDPPIAHTVQATVQNYVTKRG
jgi:hypothetical protein